MFETLTKEEKIVGAITLGGLALLAFVKPARQAVGLSDKMGKKTPFEKLLEINKLYTKIDEGIYDRFYADYEDDEDGEETFMTDELYEEIARDEFASEIKEIRNKLSKIKPSEFKNNSILLNRYKNSQNIIAKLPTIY